MACNYPTMGEGERSRWFPLRVMSILTMLVALGLTAVAVTATYAGVQDQSKRLLKERTSEVNLVLTEAIQAIPTSLQQLGAVLEATKGDTSAFATAAQQQANASPTPITLAWLRPMSSGGFKVLAETGEGSLTVGEVVTGPRAQTLQAAMHTTVVVPTPVIGATRILGFAIGPPSAPAGAGLYREATLRPAGTPPRAASTAPFSELDVALYSMTKPEPSSILTSTTRELPLTGQVRHETLVVGRTKWLLEVKARSPLVGRLTASAP